MSTQTETVQTETHPDASASGAGVSYSAVEHTVTVDGGWPFCAGCGEPGSHEVCVTAELAIDDAIRERVERRRVGRPRPSEVL